MSQCLSNVAAMHVSCGKCISVILDVSNVVAITAQQPNTYCHSNVLASVSQMVTSHPKIAVVVLNSLGTWPVYPGRLPLSVYTGLLCFIEDNDDLQYSKMQYSRSVCTCTVTLGVGTPGGLLVCCRGRHVVSHASFASHS